MKRIIESFILVVFLFAFVSCDEEQSISVKNVAEINGVKFSKIEDMKTYLEEQETGNFSMTILNDYQSDGELHLELKGINLTIDGNNHTYKNTHRYQEGDGTTEIMGIVLGSADYSQYRPSVTVKNLNVESQFEAFYASDTIDVILENCSGKTNFTQGNDGFSNLNTHASYSETALAVSYNASLTVNGGSFTSTGCGASVFTSGGKIVLNNCRINSVREVFYVYTPTSTESESNSSVIVNSGNYKGALFEGTGTGYNGYVAKLEISGGAFDHNPSSYCKTNYTATENPSGTWTVVSL